MPDDGASGGPVRQGPPAGGPRTPLALSVVGLLAGLVSLLVGLANAVRHGSPATTTATVAAGLGILGSVGFTLGRPPADSRERGLYLVVIGAFYLSVLVALLWIAFA